MPIRETVRIFSTVAIANHTQKKKKRIEIEVEGFLRPPIRPLSKPRAPPRHLAGKPNPRKRLLVSPETTIRRSQRSGTNHHQNQHQPHVLLLGQKANIQPRSNSTGFMTQPNKLRAQIKKPPLLATNLLILLTQKFLKEPDMHTRFYDIS